VQVCYDTALLSGVSRQIVVSSVRVEMSETDHPATQRHMPNERRYQPSSFLKRKEFIDQLRNC